MFGAKRKYDHHTGIDLYAPEGTPVFSIYNGRVTRVEQFTGEKVGTGWWNDTMAVVVEHLDTNSAPLKTYLVYGEIVPAVKPGDIVKSGQLLGHVATVLKKDKGKPMSMLHIEKYVTKDANFTFADWPLEIPKEPLDIYLENLHSPIVDIMFTYTRDDFKTGMIFQEYLNPYVQPMYLIAKAGENLNHPTLLDLNKVMQLKKHDYWTREYTGLLYFNSQIILPGQGFGAMGPNGAKPEKDL